MFQALSSKVISGVVSLGMLLFSSYEGNIAEFGELNISYGKNRVIFKTELRNAFENDFEEVFKSGHTFEINFEIKLKSGSRILHEGTFIHSVKYDPMEQYYHVYLQDSERNILIADFNRLKEVISEIEYEYNGDIPTRMKIYFTAYLNKMRLSNDYKEYDMMMLWKFKKPKIKTTIIKPDYES